MIKKQSVIKNYIYQFGYQFIILVIPLVLSPYLTRVLGGEGLGIYAYTYSIAYYFVIIAMLGINRHGQRVIATNSEREIELRRKFWSLLSVHAFFSVLSLLLYIFFVIVLVKDNKDIYYLQAIFVASALFDITWFFQGLENFKSVVIRNLCVKLASTVAIFAFVKNNQDVWLYTFITAMSVLIGQIVMLPQAIKIARPIRFEWKDAKEHFKPLFVLAVSVIAAALYTVFDKTLLGLLSSTQNVAFYEYSYKIISIPTTFITVIGTVLYPRVCSMVAKNDVEGQKRYYRYSVHITGFIGMGSIFGLLALAQPIADIYYGSSFSACGPVIAIMSPLIFIVGFGDVIRTQYMIPRHLDGKFASILFINAGVNILLSLALIPIIGIYGAVTGTIVAEIVGLILEIRISREIFDFKELILQIIPYVLIGLVTFFVLRFISSLTEMRVGVLIIEIIVGFLLYSSLTLLYCAFFQKSVLANMVNKIKSKIANK